MSKVGITPPGSKTYAPYTPAVVVGNHVWLSGQINIDAGDHPTSNTQMAIQQFQKDFNKYFMNHLLRNYCSIIRESAPKRQYICELIYHHCQHDL